MLVSTVSNVGEMLDIAVLSKLANAEHRCFQFWRDAGCFAFWRRRARQPDVFNVGEVLGYAFNVGEARDTVVLYVGGWLDIDVVSILERCCRTAMLSMLTRDWTSKYFQCWRGTAPSSFQRWRGTGHCHAFTVGEALDTAMFSLL